MHGDVLVHLQRGEVGQLAALGQPARVVPQQVADGAQPERLLQRVWRRARPTSSNRVSSVVIVSSRRVIPRR